jgi:transcriptional regulator with XRE-family HTH domain
MSDRTRRSQAPGEDAHAAALGRAIKVLRTDQGLDRAELAEASGLSYPYLSEIENGKKRPSSRALEGIAEALGMRPHELMASAESRMPVLADSDAVLASGAPSSERRSWLRTGAEPLMSMSAEREPRQELIDLLDHLSPDDVQRLLDLARRLSR